MPRTTDAMLTCPDRARFQELRARYESPTKLQPESLPVRQRPSSMVARKDKQAASHAAAVSSEDSGVVKLRRKLSHGLSFLSNPLSQRKTTLGREGSGSSAATASATTVPATISAVTPSRNISGRPLSPIYDCSFSHHSPGVCSPSTPPSSPGRYQVSKNDDPETTPKALPRSRTMSFIPRPSRSFSNSSVDLDRTASMARPPTAFPLDPVVRAKPTRIPSPPRSHSRRSGLRQYGRRQTPTEARHIGAGMPLALVHVQGNDQTPSKSPVRSHTTPNLVKGCNTQPGSMIHCRPELPLKSARSREMSRKENVPTNNREHPLQRSSKIQEQTSMALAQQKLLSMKNNTASGRSLGPSSPVERKQTLADSSESKRWSSNLSATTSLEARHPQPNEQNFVSESIASRSSNGVTAVQPRHMGPMKQPAPPTYGTPSSRLGLPQASTNRDLRRRTLGAASVSSDGRLSSQSKIRANQEVRLPRSSTFHSISRPCEDPPPVPPIPVDYYVAMAVKENTPGIQASPLGLGLEGRSKTAGQLPVPKSGSYFFKMPLPTTNKSSTIPLNLENDVNKGTLQRSSPPSEFDNTIRMSRTSTALAPKIDLMDHEASELALRPGSTSAIYQGCADLNELPQVIDHMPPLWWAGRFQSRLDRWRSDAMKAELDARHKPDGLLGQCKLNEDKTASCYIFLQLRDLCGSGKAAESLWEFEYRYRQEHSLLEATTSSGFFSEQSEVGLSTPKQSSFGKAVRKLTPRKASLVNLLRGRGWNKADEHPDLAQSPRVGF